MSSPTIFTQIINGDLPSHKIYEDDKTFAFLNIYPSVPGHTLIVPKVEVDHLDELDDDMYQALMATAKKVMSRTKQVLGTKRACLKVQGFDVPHAHVHVIGCDNPTDFVKPENHRDEPNHEELAAMARRLAF